MPNHPFEPTANGYAGRVRLFGIDEAIVLVGIDPSDAENAPAYRIHLDDEDGPEIGAAWKRVGERAGEQRRARRRRRRRRRARARGGD